MKWSTGVRAHELPNEGTATARTGCKAHHVGVSGCAALAQLAVTFANTAIHPSSGRSRMTECAAGAAPVNRIGRRRVFLAAPRRIPSLRGL